ncbi:MAG TPA: GvpL/GvpF family gas vesicle protein [Actinocatenispora sp.]
MSAVWVYAVTDRYVPVDVSGVHDAPVRPIRRGPLTAAVSSVPLAEFGLEPLRRNMSELTWLEPVARAHHRVVARLAGTVVPLRLASVYRDDAGVAALLAERADELTTALRRVAGCTEWGVKAYAPAAPPAPAEAATADSPGVAYLARRRAERTARDRARSAAVELADRVDTTLRRLATAHRRHEVRDAWPGAAAPVLSASYLVADTRRVEFTDAVAALAATGRVDLTGPWPPYSFAGLEQT